MDYSENWKNLYKMVTENNGYYEMGSVNWYNLTSILEDLYVENAELKARVEALENDKKQWAHPESSVASNNINFEGCYD
jgi:hypothetical protein